jgi:Lysozyme inhibitor LprI
MGLIMRTAIASVILSVLTIIAAVTAQAQAPAPQTAPSVAPPAQAPESDPESSTPARRACGDVMYESTNKWVACLEQTLAKLDADLTAVLKRIPTSEGVKYNALDPGVVPSGKKHWQTNFAALGPAFRAYREKDCEDDGIAAFGYGMGGYKERLECQINETSRQIDKLKARYDLK